MSNYLQQKRFRDIDLDDPFFDSLKADYEGFSDWFAKKNSETAYVLEDNGIQGFLYFKVEKNIVNDVKPPIAANTILKIGTLKINPHGTRLGERFIKKALDHAIEAGAEICYVTVFKKHSALVDLLKKYGFVEHGVKEISTGDELVLTKTLTQKSTDPLLHYPLISTQKNNKYLLGIYPQYHTYMFPDSKLFNESFNILEDCSHTNSIHKVYLSGMGMSNVRKGDLIVIYRTTDGQGPAEYRSVATSICVVEEVLQANSFTSYQKYFDYVNPYSIFDEDTIKTWYNKGRSSVIKMTYNAALNKRLIRQVLADEVGLSREDRWSFIQLTEDQFDRIVELGEVNESLIID